MNTEHSTESIIPTENRLKEIQVEPEKARAARLVAVGNGHCGHAVADGGRRLAKLS